MNSTTIRSYATLIRSASTLVAQDIGDDGVGLYVPAMTPTQARTLLRNILDTFRVSAPEALANCRSPEQLVSAFDSYLIDDFDSGHYFDLVCIGHGRTVYIAIDRQEYEWSSPLMLRFEFGLGDGSVSAWKEFEELVNTILLICDSCMTDGTKSYALFGQAMDVMASDSHLDGWIATLGLGDSDPCAVVSINSEEIDFRKS